MKSMSLISLFLFTFATTAWTADERPPVFPGSVYDPAVPTLEQVVGFDFGERITMHHEAIAFAKALAAASPKVSLRLRGHSWQGRPMGLLIISSAANLSKLDDFQQRYRAIADPRVTDEARFGEVAEGLPAAVLLQESVHGNEISGVDSGLFLAYHLAAVQNQAETARMLDDGLLLIEINQNPDGRDRFVHYSRDTATPVGDPDPQAAERRGQWPSGRYNHYHFDMNRDWFAVSQLETQTKVKSFLDWFPQVTVDLHEMGSESSFFAAAPSPPANPFLPQTMLDAYVAYGKEIGKLFDARGIDYFHGETFDSFYPGYGESWPSLHGSMGVLFEQASARGLQYRRRDGSILTYAEAVRNQTLASYAVFRYAAMNRQATLRFFYDNRKQAIAEAKSDRQIFLLPGDDPARAVALARLLRRQGIEVEQLRDNIKSLSVKDKTNGPVSKIEIPKGAALVRLDQPAGRLARTLLLDRVEMGVKFIERQKELLAKRQNLEIYDVTAWSLPMAYGVPIAIAVGGGWRGEGATDLATSPQASNLEAQVGYLIPNGFNLGPAMADLLRQGVRISYTAREIRHQGRSFAKGSLVVRRRDNPENIAPTLEKLSRDHEIDIVGVDTSWFEEGPGFGSNSVVRVKPPRVGLLWNRPAGAMSAGWARYVMEQEFKYPVTLLRANELASYDLARYDVLIMPSGSAGGWARVLGSAGGKKIVDWVRDGGALVTLGASVSWLIREETALLDTVREKRDGVVVKDDKVETHPAKLEEDKDLMIKPRDEYPRAAFGALLQVRFDTSHWLAYGMPETHAAMVFSNRIYRPLRLDAGLNPGRYDEAAQVLLSGFVPEETIDQLAHKPFLMTTRHGRGVVVAFTEDPNFRAFLKGLRPLLRNAVFLGPTRTR